MIGIHKKVFNGKEIHRNWLKILIGRLWYKLFRYRLFPKKYEKREIDCINWRGELTNDFFTELMRDELKRICTKTGEVSDFVSY